MVGRRDGALARIELGDLFAHATGRRFRQPAGAMILQIGQIKTGPVALVPDDAD